MRQRALWMAALAALAPACALALEINSATRAQLEQLPGLGVATTERILQARARQPFADWADLAARVPGVGGKRAQQLARHGLTVNGIAAPASGEKPR